MNPMVTEIIGSVVRWGITALVALLAGKSLLTPEQSAKLSSPEVILYVTGIVVPLAWSIYQKYVSRQKLLTGLASPNGTTEAEVEQQVKSGVVTPPPVTLPKHEIAYLTGPDASTRKTATRKSKDD